MSYFVFVDNSNVWIEGKFASAVARGWAKNTVDAHMLNIQDASWRLDFGKLLQCVTSGHVHDIKKAVLFGSKLRRELTGNYPSQRELVSHSIPLSSVRPLSSASLARRVR